MQGEKASLAKQNQKQESAAAAAVATQAFAGQSSGGAPPYGSSAAASGDPTVRVQRWGSFVEVEGAATVFVRGFAAIKLEAGFPAHSSKSSEGLQSAEPRVKQHIC